MTKRIDVSELPAVVGTLYPPPFDLPCRPRQRTKLGDSAGLTQFGVNLLRLPPGAWSGQRHWHTKTDEFFYVLAGEVMLVTDDGEVLILEIGSRAADDVGHYSVIDMLAHADGKPAIYTHRDGTPYTGIRRRGPGDD